MSLPRKGTTFGTLELNNNTYDIFSRPLSKHVTDKLYSYMKFNGVGLTSAPWSTNKYKWEVIDKKLYLTFIHLFNDKIENCIFDIFGNKKLFADWLTDDITILISKKDILEADATMTEEEKDAISKRGQAFVQREVKVLSFSNGELINESDCFTEKYIDRWRLKDYLID